MLKKTLKTMSGVIAAGVLSVTGSAVLAEVNFEGETVTIIIPFKRVVVRHARSVFSLTCPNICQVAQWFGMPGGGTIKGGNFSDNQKLMEHLRLRHLHP